MNAKNQNILFQILETATKNLPDKTKLKAIKGFHLHQIQNEWENIVSDIFAIHTYPNFLKNEILYIIADHSVFLNQIRMLENQIIINIQNKTGITVKKIQTKIGRILYKNSFQTTTENNTTPDIFSNSSNDSKEVITTNEKSPNNDFLSILISKHKEI